MRLLWHLLATDGRRFRALVVLWMVVLAAEAAAEVVRPVLAADPAVREAAGLAGYLIWLARLLLALAVVPIVMQADPLVGSDAFWMTRPIPPRILFASKAVLLGSLLIAAPIVPDAIVMAAHDVPPAQSAGVLAQSSLHRLFWATLLMVAAALTPTLARFALLCGAAVAALAIALSAFVAVDLSRMDALPPAGRVVMHEDPTAGTVGTALLIVAGVALLVVQYGTRSRTRSVLVGVGAAALAHVAASAWPWPLLAPRAETPAWAADLRVSVDPASATPLTQPPYIGGGTTWSYVRARTRIDGLAPGWSAGVGLVGSALRLHSDVVLPTAGGAHSNAVHVGDDAEYAAGVATRQAAGVQRLHDRGRSGGDMPAVLVLRHDDLLRHAPAAGELDLNLQVTLTHHAMETVLPLQAGARHQHGSYRLVLDRLEYAAGRLDIVARESNAQSVWERRSPGASTSFGTRSWAKPSPGPTTRSRAHPS